ncbi:MAG TPA: hypothetical protein VKA48_10855, partial [Gammaproteobacteria bacterium]|nr:hypothetical protein [Gammaproteobacteria bacterium]
AATNAGADCTSEHDLRKSILTQGGWYWALDSKERIFSKPFVRAGLVNSIGFKPVNDICSFGGTSYQYTVDYRTGTAPPQPVFLNASGFTGDMGSSGQIESKIELGKGVPPIGEAFAAMPRTKNGEVGAFSNTSANQMSQTKQQTDKLKQGILFLRAP